MLREALAANTIGGRAGEESKWRAMAEDVRGAQASWIASGRSPVRRAASSPTASTARAADSSISFAAMCRNSRNR